MEHVDIYRSGQKIVTNPVCLSLSLLDQPCSLFIDQITFGTNRKHYEILSIFISIYFLTR